MAKQSQTEKDILFAAHKTAFDLYVAVFMDKKRCSNMMSSALKLSVFAIQTKFVLLEIAISYCQSVFATLLNTSLSTIKKWKVSEKHPSGPSRKLLNILARKGLEALI
jgi:putative transcriptional regulator